MVNWRAVPVKARYRATKPYKKLGTIKAVDAPFEGGGITGRQLFKLIRSRISEGKIVGVWACYVEPGSDPARYYTRAIDTDYKIINYQCRSFAEGQPRVSVEVGVIPANEMDSVMLRVWNGEYFTVEANLLVNNDTVTSETYFGDLSFKWSRSHWPVKSIKITMGAKPWLGELKFFWKEEHWEKPIYK